MKYIKDYREGEKMSCVYLVKQKQSSVTKAGKPFERILIQDRTGQMDGMIWDPGSAGIEEYEAMDYVHINGDVSIYNGAFQVRINRLRKVREGEYDPADYVPVSKRNNDEMYADILKYVDSVKHPGLNALLNEIFRKDEEFIKLFRKSSAAKAVHHAFMGGLMEHTLAVARLCDFYARVYTPDINRDLLIAGALCHDMGKTREFSAFPQNDYTDEGQLIGHIITGIEMLSEYEKKVPDLSEETMRLLKHCILAHHGEYEYGSPKKPAIVEAMALNFADNTDAKFQSFREAMEQLPEEEDWTKKIYAFDGMVRRTRL